MASPPFPSVAEAAASDVPAPSEPTTSENEADLVVSFGNPVVLDYLSYLVQNGKYPIVLAPAQVCPLSPLGIKTHPIESFSRSAWLSRHGDSQVRALVIFLERRLSTPEARALEQLAKILGDRVQKLCIVSSYLGHLGDRQVRRAEERVLERLRHLKDRTIVFRPGHVLSRNSSAQVWLQRLGFAHALLPESLCGCCVEGTELFGALEQELARTESRKGRVYTLLGPNRPWRDLLKQHRQQGVFQSALVIAAGLLKLIGVGQFAAFVQLLSACWVPWLRRWRVVTLYPSCAQELVALYNPYNYRYVKVVGYNNGAVHFGHKYPGRTMVATVRCNHKSRVNGNLATFDAGVTLRQAIDAVNRAGREFYVLPNYSYISVGTPFFVPIHGSASEFPTLGATIAKVFLYNPIDDCFVTARRADPVFQDYMYNLESDVLLLRVRYRIKEKSLYYLKQTTRTDPTSQELLAVFQDDQACNVEIRKARAAEKAVQVSKYYRDLTGQADALAFPKDSLGRVWDTIEGNLLLSFLFHALMRRFGYHVELFLTPEEFGVFWRTHRSLPLRKIQLRFIKRDGVLHSPFRRHDCVSADLFMLRKHRLAFQDYVKETFREVQFNPGKHSR
jgi:hypothetical protein